jgi:hypothetical protein
LIRPIDVIKKIIQGGLGLLAGAYVIGGALAIMRVPPSAREAESLAHAWAAFGTVILIIGLLGGGAVYLGNKARVWLLVAPVILAAALPVLLFGAFWLDMEKGDVHRRQFEKEMHSGRYAFGEEPALLAVAQAVTANDQDGIRAAAKAVPNLQAAGRDGTTLLSWTVRETWQRPQLVDAVKTLLSLGADPNFTNGHRESFALGDAVHGPLAGLRAMLDAGGNPNALNEYGWPLVFMHYELAYYPDERRARLDLLLERGADINATVPATESEFPGYTLLLYRTAQGANHAEAYADALHLLERGADPNRLAPDGMTLGKLLTKQHEAMGRISPPAEFTSLWEWAQSHGLFAQP